MKQIYKIAYLLLLFISFPALSSMISHADLDDIGNFLLNVEPERHNLTLTSDQAVILISLLSEKERKQVGEILGPIDFASGHMREDRVYISTFKISPSWKNISLLRKMFKILDICELKKTFNEKTGSIETAEIVVKSKSQ